MGKRTTLVCDLCGSEENVSTLVVSYSKVRSWEMEVCVNCYRGRFAAEKYPHARTMTYTAGRPHVRLKRTVLPPQPRQPVTRSAESR